MMVDLVKQWKEAARRDDLFDHMVPSDVRLLVQEIERLREREAALAGALEGCNELFDNYGFASESPCARDREIIAEMLAALATTPAKALERARIINDITEVAREIVSPDSAWTSEWVAKDKYLKELIAKLDALGKEGQKSG